MTDQQRILQPKLPPQHASIKQQKSAHPGRKLQDNRAIATPQKPGNVAITAPIQRQTVIQQHQLNSDSPLIIQRKHRIDLSKIANEETRKKVQAELEQLKTTRKTEKAAKTKAWATSDNKDDDRDKQYNTDMEQIRKNYQVGVKEVAKKYNVEDALISGDAYFGDEVDEGGLKFFRRSDTGKEYVKDSRGTFIPRYIRRELNHRDKDKQTGEINPRITTQGISSYEDLLSQKKIGNANLHGPISWKHREFIQQSVGGGSNLFALSHTSTKRPILSNAHHSFGEKPQDFQHSGAIITDLAKLGHDKFLAQWTLDQQTGHKTLLPDTAHETLKWKNRVNSDTERDAIVRNSGYRNMEVVVNEVPKDATVQPDAHWKTQEGPKTDYHNGESKRGNALVDYRNEKQAAYLHQKAEQERLKREEAERLKREEEERLKREEAERLKREEEERLKREEAERLKREEEERKKREQEEVEKANENTSDSQKPEDKL